MIFTFDVNNGNFSAEKLKYLSLNFLLEMISAELSFFKCKKANQPFMFDFLYNQQ
jgi:hypothetical protein